MSRSTMTLDEMVALLMNAAIYGIDGGSRSNWQPERPIRDWLARSMRRVGAILRVRPRDRDV